MVGYFLSPLTKSGFGGEAPKYGTIRMASEYPKITSYIPIMGE